jgi:hypothetical protein
VIQVTLFLNHIESFVQALQTLAFWCMSFHIFAESKIQTTPDATGFVIDIWSIHLPLYKARKTWVLLIKPNERATLDITPDLLPNTTDLINLLDRISVEADIPPHIA